MYFTLQPVKGEGFIDREELLEEMFFELRDINSTTGYALYGKRRIGKTSILKEVQRRLNEFFCGNSVLCSVYWKNA